MGAKSNLSEFLQGDITEILVYNRPLSDEETKSRNGQIEIRILMDILSIETFGNRGEVSITNIAYQKDGNPPLRLNAVGGEAKVTSLTVHTLKSIWE